MRPISAKRFVDSIGIDTHPNRLRSVWGTSDWEAAFLETGVRNVRGLIGSGRPGAGAMEHVRRLFDAGVKLCATVAPERADLDLGTVGANLAFLAKNVGAGNLCGIESANEYNKPSTRPDNWATRLRQFQAWLDENVKANPNLRQVPVVGPSIWGRLTSDIITLGSLEPYLDVACLHYYTGGRRPTEAGRPSSADEGGGSSEYTLAEAVRQAKTQAPDKPLYVTEFGYPVAGPGLPLSSGFITETAAAKYLVRGLFDLFAAGAEKTFIYSLIDDVERNPPRYHGLLSGSLDRRRTFYAVKNLLAVMQDSGPGPGLQPLEVAIRAPAQVKTMLFQKGNGTFLLAMYQDVDSYDRRGARDIGVAPVPVTLSLDRPAARMEVYTPTLDTFAKQRTTNSNRLTIAVPDHVAIAAITM